MKPSMRNKGLANAHTMQTFVRRSISNMVRMVCAGRHRRMQLRKAMRTKLSRSSAMPDPVKEPVAWK